MPNKFLIKAKIVPAYCLIKNDVAYRKSIVIFLPFKTIYLYPKNGSLVVRRNGKYSLRRLIRWSKRGCSVNIRTGVELISSDYETVYLKKEDLEDMLNDVYNKEELIKEIYVNYRESNRSNDGE